MLVPAQGGGGGNTRFRRAGIEGEVEATGRRLPGENGFTFAVAGSASRSCAVGLVRLISTEVGSAGFEPEGRGGVTGTVTVTGTGRGATVSSLLSALHLLYLSAANSSRDQSQIDPQQRQPSLNRPSPPARMSSGVGLRPCLFLNSLSHDFSSILSATDSADIASGAKRRAQDLDHRQDIQYSTRTHCYNNCATMYHKYPRERVNATISYSYQIKIW